MGTRGAARSYQGEGQGYQGLWHTDTRGVAEGHKGGSIRQRQLEGRQGSSIGILGV